MPVFVLNDVNAWLEPTKLTVSTIESALSDQITEQVFSRLRNSFSNITTWTSETTTPVLVKSIVAMLYAAAIYERAYGDDHDDTNNYAGLLRAMAEANITGLQSGILELAEDTGNQGSSAPAYFPSDASSANPASMDAPSDGGPYFTMGMVF